MIREYCTYFDERYLDKALALAHSLEQHAGPHVLHCVTMTDTARRALDLVARPNIVPLPIETIEAEDPELAAVKASRSRLTYYWTTTPAVMLHYLKHERKPGITYLDADLFFFSDPEAMFAEDPAADLYIHEHRHDKPFLWYAARGGRFNVGLVGASNTPNAVSVLERWRRQCLDHCSAEQGKGKYGDQIYLNDWPTSEARVHIIQHTGAGVAPWNILESSVKTVDGRPWINGAPLLFYHFHAMLRRGRDDWTLARRYYLPTAVRREIYQPYLKALDAASAELRKRVPGYANTVIPRTLAERFWDTVFAYRAGAHLAWWVGGRLRG